MCKGCNLTLWLNEFRSVYYPIITATIYIYIFFLISSLPDQTPLTKWWIYFFSPNMCHWNRFIKKKLPELTFTCDLGNQILSKTLRNVCTRYQLRSFVNCLEFSPLSFLLSSASCGGLIWEPMGATVPSTKLTAVACREILLVPRVLCSVHSLYALTDLEVDSCFWVIQQSQNVLFFLGFY